MRRAASAILAVTAVLSLAGPAVADPGEATPIVIADVAGKPIDITEIPSYNCHDRAFPKIHCFESASDLEQAMSVEQPGMGIESVTATNYVVIYDEVSYHGGSMYVSQNYDTLAVVGWNDRIRSYKGLNGARGVFYIDWFATGSSLTFCCNVLDPSLPTAFDRQITSVYRQ
jgi:hypothetical protein